MSVEFNCASCGKLLRVPDENAGGKAECPSCGIISDVPDRQTSPLGEDDPWKVRTPEGDVYGPVSKAELDRWLAEGRLSADCHLMQGGGSQWRPAAEVYPRLSTAGAHSAAPGTPSRYVPPTNPYGSPTAVSTANYSPGSNVRQHRGAMILVFGILGIVFCICFAPFAWVMGRNDLDAMNAGVMDKSGYGLKQAGWICGIIGTLLFLFQIAAFVIIFGAMIATGEF